jgi:hypothetical protein
MVIKEDSDIKVAGMEHPFGFPGTGDGSEPLKAVAPPAQRVGFTTQLSIPLNINIPTFGGYSVHSSTFEVGTCSLNEEESNAVKLALEGYRNKILGFSRSNPIPQDLKIIDPSPATFISMKVFLGWSVEKSREYFDKQLDLFLELYRKQ